MSRRTKIFYNAAGIVVALILWQIVGMRLGNALFAPPTALVTEFGPELRDGSVFVTLADSLRQMFLGFALAFGIGVPLGILMARSRLVDAVVHPWLSMAVVTSVAALVPLFNLIFGTGFWFRVWIVFVTAIWFIMLTVYQGARGIEPRWLEVGRSFGAHPLQSFWKIMLPALFPYIFAGARIGLIHAIRAMVVAEMFVVVGFGALIHNAGLSISTAPLLGLLVILMILGILANWGLREVSRMFAPWYEERIKA